MFNNLEKKQNDLIKSEKRLTEVISGINNFQNETEKNLSEGKNPNYQLLGTLETEKKLLEKMIVKLRLEIADLEAKKIKEDLLVKIELQKKAAELHCRKINQKITEGFELILSALNEKTLDISAMTEKFSSDRTEEFLNKINGRSLFKEIIKTAFPSLKVDPHFKKFELNNFSNISDEKLKQISEKFI